jgi:hypothetical protein
MIHKQEAIENVLRLLVLLSLTNAGLPKKNFDYLRYDYVAVTFCVFLLLLLFFPLLFVRPIISQMKLIYSFNCFILVSLVSLI